VFDEWQVILHSFQIGSTPQNETSGKPNFEFVSYLFKFVVSLTSEVQITVQS
jgi:hypothetical protein